MTSYGDVASVVMGIGLYVFYSRFGCKLLQRRSRSAAKQAKQAENESSKGPCEIDEGDKQHFLNTEPGPEPHPDEEPTESIEPKIPAPKVPPVARCSSLRIRCREIVVLAVLVALMLIRAIKDPHALLPRVVQKQHENTVGRVSASSPAIPPVSIDLQRQQMTIYSGRDITYYKIAYYATLHLGTPSVGFTFVMDTGSGHLIIPSAYCKSASCLAHKRYRRSASTSAVDVSADGKVEEAETEREQLTIEFGTGEITGVFVEDLVCVSPQETSDEVANGASGELATTADVPKGCVRMKVVAATEMSEDPFRTFEFDGILGLGLESLSRTQSFNFMSVLGGVIGDLGADMPHTFAMFLGEASEQSKMLVGGWSEDHVDGDLFWNPLHEPEHGHWMLKVLSIRVDDQYLDYCAEGCKAVVDSGTSLMAVPTVTFAELYDKLWHSAGVDGECEGHGPQMHIQLEHITLTLGPRDYSRPHWFKKLRGTNKFGGSRQVKIDSNNFGKTRTDMYCRPMMMTMDMEPPVGPKLFILGEPVLRKYYTVYDTDGLRIGLGLANHGAVDDGKLQQSQEEEEKYSDDSWWFEADDDEQQQPEDSQRQGEEQQEQAAEMETVSSGSSELEEDAEEDSEDSGHEAEGSHDAQ